MNNQQWSLLAKRFYEFKNEADPLGFYVPELEGMERSLLECCPFGGHEEFIKQVKDMAEDKVNYFGYRKNRIDVEAVQIGEIDTKALSIKIIGGYSPEWLDSSIKSKTIMFVDDKLVVNGLSRNYEVHVGDYVCYLPDGQLLVYAPDVFEANFEKAETYARVQQNVA